MRLPRTLVFPFGYRVKVVSLTPTEMTEENEGEPVDGLWDCGTRTIYVSKGVPITRQRYILAHEMQHALLDYMHAMSDEGVMKP